MGSYGLYACMCLLKLLVFNHWLKPESAFNPSNYGEFEDENITKHPDSRGYPCSLCAHWRSTCLEGLIMVMHLTITQHEKTEWARMAQNAYANGSNSYGHRFSSLACLPDGAQLPVGVYDTVMRQYRTWLIDGIQALTFGV